MVSEIAAASTVASTAIASDGGAGGGVVGGRLRISSTRSARHLSHSSAWATTSARRVADSVRSASAWNVSASGHSVIAPGGEYTRAAMAYRATYLAALPAEPRAALAALADLQAVLAGPV